MRVSRRAFSLGSVFAFLTGTTASGQETDAPDLPRCEAGPERVGNWDVRASLYADADGAPSRSWRLFHQGESWLFHRVGETEEWPNVTAGHNLEFYESEAAEEEPSLSLRLTVSATVVGASGQTMPLIPIELGEEGMTFPVRETVTLIGGEERVRAVDMADEVTLSPGREQYRFWTRVPVSAMAAGADRIMIGFEFGEAFGIGLIAELNGMPEAMARGQAMSAQLYADMEAGRCARPAPVSGGCFVVTAATKASEELQQDGADLDLILSARDALLDRLPQYWPAANQYYATSPLLVEKIDQSNHRLDIYTRFLKRSVLPAQWFIQRGWSRIGFVILGLGIEVLYRKYLPEVLPPSAFAPGRKPALTRPS